MPRRILGSITAELNSGVYNDPKRNCDVIEYWLKPGQEGRKDDNFSMTPGDYEALGRPKTIRVKTKVEVIGR